MSAGPSVVVASGDMLGESATWSARESALYWIDIRAPALLRFEPATGEHRRWPLPEICGGVVPTPSGVLLALRREIAHFDPASGATRRVCAVEPESAGNRLNEAKCDRSGRLLVGSMRDYAAATTGSLYRVSHQSTVERLLGGITVPNSVGWSPDGRAMYFSDTARGAIWIYDYSLEGGAIRLKGELVPPDWLPGRPDGCTVDAEGHVWTTRVGAGCVFRIGPDGRVTDSIELPTDQPTSCALGGPGLRTLFITTARQRLDANRLHAQPTAGHLFAHQVDVPGLADTEFVAEPRLQKAGDLAPHENNDTMGRGT